MQNSIFYRLGTVIYRLRWYIIALWLLVIAVSILFLPNVITPFKNTGFIDEKSESTQAQQSLDNKLQYNKDNKFIIIYYSKQLLNDNPLYLKKIKDSLATLKNFPIKNEIILPDENNKQLSKDKHTAYVVVIFNSATPISDALLTKFKQTIKTPTNMTIQLGGEPIFVENLNKQIVTDLSKADLIATPAAIITLIIVFGSVCAALIPIILGGSCTVIILATLYFLGHILTLSIFTLNIAVLLVLCLSLDYSLFIISRFREELRKGLPIIAAIAVTQATAGKAIFFSGLAVFVSLSALLLFPINILFSVAIGGLTAVLLAVLIAIILLPAMLSVLQSRINLLSVKIFQNHGATHRGFWHWLATTVVGRPVRFFFSILILLLMLGFPFLSVQFGVSDFRILPEHSKHRSFFDTYSKKFDERDLTPILLVVHTTHSTIFSHASLSKLVNLAKELKHNPLIENVDSIVTTKPQLTKQQLYTMYNMHQNMMSTDLKQLLETTTRPHLTVMTIISKYPVNSPQMRTLIKNLRTMYSSHGIKLQLTGTPVGNIELLQRIAHTMPYVIMWIMLFTYLVLLLLLRSLFLPIKAIFMNILSLCACYGVLVLIFQDGHLHQWLNFEPQGMLDISLVVIIFCAIFGFSIDYEVFLLTRIKEEYERCGDNKKSIIFGIENSSRIITSAAIIVMVICGSFLFADVLMVKAFGLGIATAIFVDAFLIRTLLVPATMALLKHWNWYLPKWLGKMLPRL